MDKIAIIGGSGIKDSPQFRDVEWKSFDTKYSNGWGDGIVDYQQNDEVIFIPRHGRDETCRYLPSRAQYGANLIAAKELCATVVVAISAVGSLVREINVRDLVIPNDQKNDSGRDSNFYGVGFGIHGNPMKPSPFSEAVRTALIEEGNLHFQQVHKHGVYVTIPGDFFGTPIEGRTRAQYAEIVGMTLFPEVEMAIQLDLHYGCAAIPVDNNLDASHEDSTIRNMTELSEVVPAFVSGAIKRLRPLAADPPKLEQLMGNIIPADERGLARIQNEFLRENARR